jgi:hypothetical protein
MNALYIVPLVGPLPTTWIVQNLNDRVKLLGVIIELYVLNQRVVTLNTSPKSEDCECEVPGNRLCSLKTS